MKEKLSLIIGLVLYSGLLEYFLLQSHLVTGSRSIFNRRYPYFIKHFLICPLYSIAEKTKTRTVFIKQGFTTLTLIIGAVILLPFAMVETFTMVSQKSKHGRLDLV